MFELLFNYPVSLWQEATLVFNSGWSLTALLLVFFCVVLALAASLWRRSISVSKRLSIATLQVLVSAILLLMLWQPALLVGVSERGENTVAWVLDQSLSMNRQDALTAADRDQAVTRFAAALDVIETAASSGELEFSTAFYGIGNTLTPVAEASGLRNLNLSARSDLVSGIDTLLGTVNETALAAVVLVSDGADNSDKVTPEWWQALAGAGVPVHTIGVGQLSEPADLELADVTLPSLVQPETLVSARLRIRHAQGGPVRIRVLAGKELVAAEDVSLPEGVNQSLHTLRFSSGVRGVRQLEFQIDWTLNSSGLLAAADPFPGNNRQPRVMQVLDSPKRILYVEGEPRWEYKFLRRAMDSHPGIDVVSLLRTSPNKFYRQGVADASELANGFPETREQLFSYDALIIGSFEAAELTSAQQIAVRDFVSERGGSLLMLGGRQGLADGGWGRSVVAAALPVVLNNRLSSETFSRQRSNVIPTIVGLRTPWLRLDESDTANIEAWRGLPELADVQSVGQVKPGALILLERESIDSGVSGSEPLLVTQRYGKGRSAVLGTSGTWRWQMSLPSEDERHERFWRQLLSTLVENSVPRVAIELSQPVLRDADSAVLSVSAYNPDYSNVQQAFYPVQVTAPDGSSQTVELAADIARPGRYTGKIPYDADGPYAVLAMSSLDGESPAVRPVAAEQWWVGESGNAELYSAQLHEGFLQRIADTTGGSYLALSDAGELDALLAQENAALKRDERLPLWNMPAFFLGLLLLKGLEWLLRLRWKRL